MHHRTKIVILGSCATFTAKALGFVSQVAVLFLFARHLDALEFGLWSVLSSLALLVGMFDFGITGHGLRNKLAEMASKPESRDEEAEKKIFLAIFYLSILIYAAFSLLALALIPLVPWHRLFSYDSPSKLPLIFILVMLPTLFRTAFVINTNGFFAYQKAHIRSLFEILEYTLLCLSAAVGIIFKLPLIPLIGLYYFAFFLGPFISFLSFLRLRKWRLMKISLPEMVQLAKPILSTSVYFWVYHTCSLAFFSLQPFLVGHFVGLKEAGDFGVVQKCFTLFLGVHFTLLVPLWSAFTHAASSLDFDWIRKIFQKALIFTGVIFTIGIPLMLLLFKPAVYYWTGKIIERDMAVYLMGLFTFLFAWINCFSVLLSGLNRIKTQALFILLGLIGNLTVSMIFKTTTGLLMSGIFFILPLLISNIIQVRQIIPKRGTLSSTYNWE